MSALAAKEHAHELIDRMEPAQVQVVVELLEDLLDPLSVKLANAPFDDEPITQADLDVIASSSTARTISTEEMLADFGLTVEDFQRLAERRFQEHVAAH